jgi:hypothetical protein
VGQGQHVELTGAYLLAIGLESSVTTGRGHAGQEVDQIDTDLAGATGDEYARTHADAPS